MYNREDDDLIGECIVLRCDNGKATSEMWRHKHIVSIFVILDLNVFVCLAKNII